MTYICEECTKGVPIIDVRTCQNCGAPLCEDCLKDHEDDCEEESEGRADDMEVGE
ncbi:MAG TPA: hypothetical protein ENH84_07425 [Phycisphaerae bacterium]|nr:hypothetical protein [Phycisphaerae bacterium]